jgi:DNA-binding NarL/FixJ family response regulator
MRNAPKPWTRKEEEELRALIRSGKSVEAIAMKLGRTPPSIRKKAHKLKLLLKIIY